MANVIYIIAAIIFIARIFTRNRNKMQGDETSQKLKNTFSAMRPDAVAQNQTTSAVRVNQNSRKKANKTNKKSMNLTSASTSSTFASLAAADSPDQQRNGESMTDYLSRRAHEDEVERKKEEWEERREEQKNLGNLRLASRLQFGATPPRGTVVKTCSYCGAENLVPYTSHEKFHCYFCHSSLK